ncbi:MAG: hypothetical protein ACYC3L_15405 [Gemmatimonadaceae bacterium]
MRSLLAAALAAAFVAAACHGNDSPIGVAVAAGLGNCSASTRPFTVSPLPVEAISGWVPLGNLNPPGHTFPTDHQYIYLTSAAGGSPAPLVAPGDLYVTQAKSTRYSTGTTAEDYAVTFTPCQQVLGEFGHVRTLTPALAQALGPFDLSCNSYSPDGSLTVTQCYSRVTAIRLKAGDPMGTSAGLDFTLTDTRTPAGQFANNARWTADRGSALQHVVPASDYFDEPVRSRVRALLGRFDGRIKRTIEPLGGTIYSDIPGTAEGAWIKSGSPTYPESPHLAIVPDNVQPDLIAFSVGLSQAGLASGAFQVQPLANGTIDRAPGQVVPGSTIYCYDLRYFVGNAPVATLLLQLVDANTLKVEAHADGSACAAQQARAFTASAVTYVR